MNKIADNIAKVIEVIVVALTAVMSVLVIANVFMRFVFDSGIVISEELSRYLFIWIVFLGAIVAMRRNAHIYVDFIRNSLPPMIQWVVRLVVDLFMVYVCYLLTVGAIELADYNMADHSPVANIPMGYIYISGAVGGVGMALMLIVRIIAMFSELKDLNKAKEA